MSDLRRSLGMGQGYEAQRWEQHEHREARGSKGMRRVTLSLSDSLRERVDCAPRDIGLDCRENSRGWGFHLGCRGRGAEVL